MNKVETIEDFYDRKFDWMPENFKNEIGHFNVFNLEPVVDGKIKPVPYKRRDFYKITLVKVTDSSKIHFADQIITVKKQALSFSSPKIPYKWEQIENIKDCAFCIFNQHFFHQFGNLDQYSVFQPNGTHIFELTDEQVERIEAIFKRMFEEINSQYVYKYDVLRNLVFEILHFAMKMEPSTSIENKHLNASQRITALFLELLERQFPIDEAHQKIELRMASDFANQLNIHVNHLNRAVKEITAKTTSQIIAERILQESKILLKHSSWNVSEIAHSLGFGEVTYFNNFFKKHSQMSPLKFRKE
ncbi:helix-turn-helix domain-containing protein [Flavobacterium sp.]|uniref:helix-turn-helix domain-containing protein n=1 Tax=Flavobacterium sp. TaxID=239 RepID=UPI00379CB254